MPVIKLDTFGGMLPGVDDRLLPNNAAASSIDVDDSVGTLIGWRKPKVLHNLVSGTTKAVLRVPQVLTNTAIGADSYWVEFDDVDTKVVRSPIVDDTFQRYYYSSPSQTPKYNITSRIAAGDHAWLLGLNAPTDAPGVSPAGGTGAGIATSRAYVYTWVTAYGEESAPSPPLVQNGFEDDTWQITMTSPTGADMGTDRNILYVRIYRTVTDTTGNATYFLVDELDIVTTTYNDSFTDDTVSENNELDSATWTPPPTDLRGFVLGANGMIAGFRENEIWFCEPFRPHAWPSTYVLTTEYPIVGIGVCGQAFIAITTGYPVVFSGPAPNAITSHVIRKSEPCTSAGSIVSAPDAVYYVSINGLVAVTPYGTASNTTEAWITRPDWNEIVPIHSARGFVSGGAYTAFGSVYTDPATAVVTDAEAQDGFSIQSPQTTSQRGAVPAGGNIVDPAFSLMTAPNDYDIYNVQIDFWTDVPMLIQNQTVYYYDFADAAPNYQPYLWKSKVFQMGNKRNLSAFRVWFAVPSTEAAQSATRNINTTQTLQPDQYALVRFYAGNGATLSLITCRELRESGELLRVTGQQKYAFWQIEIEGNVEILNLQAATSVKELAQV